jgi:hypothetical protein
MTCKLEDDPLSLSGLAQALYVAKCLQFGLSEQEITIKFSGDSQLVKMWIIFLTYSQWMQSMSDDQNNQKWMVTDKGKTWLATIEAKFSNVNT